MHVELEGPSSILWKCAAGLLIVIALALGAVPAGVDGEGTAVAELGGEDASLAAGTEETAQISSSLSR